MDADAGTIRTGKRGADMNKKEFEKNIGKMVEITLFDGDVVKGCLRKSHDELFKDDPNLFYPQKRYFVTENEKSKKCISCLFRSSHVRKIKPLKA